MLPLALVPLALVFAQSPLARPVTIDQPAMPLGRLAPLLSQAAGVEVVAAGNVEKDVVLVRVKNVPLGELLKRIAEEDGSELETTAKGFRLVRTASSERKEHRAALSKRIESLRPAIDEARKGVALAADEATYRTIVPALKAELDRNPSSVALLRGNTSAPIARTPATRAALRATLAVPEDFLADLQEGDRAVFSNLPTRLQRPLPALEGILKSFSTEQNAWIAAVGRFPGIEPSQYADDPFRFTSPIDGPATRAVLMVSRGNSPAAANVRIVLLDRQSKCLGVGNYSLRSVEAQKGIDEAWKPTNTAPIDVSKETQALIDGLPTMDGGGATDPSAEAIAILSKPETQDPLSFGATDLLREVAGDRPVVAVLPDSAWFVGLFRKGGLKRSDLAVLESTVDRRISDGWLLARPREPEIARRNRVDRTALGRFIRTIVAEKRVPLDAYATYAWNASDAPSDILGVPIAMMLGSGTFNPDVDWRILRLFGSLSQSNRREMANGAKKGWATLSKSQQALASWIVGHKIGSVQYLPGEKVPPEALMMEPTEVFAQGFDTLEISMRVSKDAPLFCDSTTKNVRMGWRRVLPANEVGNYLAMSNGPEFDRFGMSKRTTYTLSLSARKNVSTSASLEDVVPPRGSLKPLTDLPESIQETVKASIESAARQKSEGGVKTAP